MTPPDLYTALQKYGQHAFGCATLGTAQHPLGAFAVVNAGPCDCGLAVILAASPPSPAPSGIDPLRDVLIRAHGMATGPYVQDDAEMRRRIGAALEQAIESDDIMRGVLGRGGPMAHLDFLAGPPSPAPSEPVAWPTREVLSRLIWGQLNIAPHQAEDMADAILILFAPALATAQAGARRAVWEEAALIAISWAQAYMSESTYGDGRKCGEQIAAALRARGEEEK